MFAVAGLPLPWLLGALFVTAVAMASRMPVGVPTPCVQVAHVILALLIGSRFQPDMLSQAAHWPLLVAVTLALFVLTFGAGWLFFRKVARYDSATATFAAAPGGFVMLMMLAQEIGGDTRRIAVVHAMRVLAIFGVVPLLLTVLAAPAEIPGAAAETLSQGQHPVDWLVLASLGAIGVAIGGMLRLPGRTVLGPLILSAAAHATGLIATEPPAELLAAVQVIIGISVGLRFAGLRLTMLIRDMILGLGWASIILGTAILGAFLLAPSLGQEASQLILIFTPGGLPETSVMALGLGLDVASIVVCNMARFLAIAISVPSIVSLLPASRRDRDTR